MKRYIIRITILLTAAATIAGCNGASRKAKAEEALKQAQADSIAAAEKLSLEQKQQQQKEKEVMPTIESLPEEPVFDIVTNMGTIKVKLYRKTPRHRLNFEKLALSGYYDSLLFHRVINGFIIQGGDPNTLDTLRETYGMGGPAYTIPAEIKEGMEAGYRHKKGALAAARKGDAANPMKESSGSQFYIVQDAANCSHLDGEYTVFGETVAGMAVIDKIARVKTDRRDMPLNDVRIITIKPDKSDQNDN